MKKPKPKNKATIWDVIGISPRGILLGVQRFRKPNIPRNGKQVIWIWSKAGQITAGDYFERQPRDASKNYEPIKKCKPSHWMPWPDNWPKS